MFVNYISTLSFQSLGAGGGVRAAEKGIQRGQSHRQLGRDEMLGADVEFLISMFPPKLAFLFTDHKSPPLSSGECH